MADSNPPRKSSGRSSFSRKLNKSSQVRNRIRKIGDRVLAADVGWSTALVATVLLLLGTQHCGTPGQIYSIGQIATADIVARSDIEIPDLASTEQRRKEKMEGVHEFYRHDLSREKYVIDDMVSLIQNGRQKLEATDSGREASTAWELPDRYEGEVADVLARYKYSEQIQTQLTDAVRSVMRGMIVGNQALLENEPVITIVHVPGGREEVRSEYVHILDLAEARAEVRDQIDRTLKYSSADRRALGELGASFVDANLHHDPEQTRERRAGAADGVRPMWTKVVRGTVLVPLGSKIDSDDLAILEAIREETGSPFGLLEWLGLVAMVAMITFFLFRYASYHQRDFRKIRRLHALLVLIMISMLFLARGMMWVIQHITAALPDPLNHSGDYVFLVPISAGAVLVTLLATGRIAMVFSIFTALFYAALFEWQFFVVIWALLVQFAAVYAITTYRDRAALLRAGVMVGLFAAAACLAVEAIQGRMDGSRMAYAAGLAFAGGAIGNGLLVSFSLPLLEGAFNVLTAIRLLELSNLDNPVLSRMAVKAPGSYNHSLVVGSLAEEGARAIRANALFCRVAACYHDIGKMVKPDYYVENQDGENPHNNLLPSMSALIIASHVKDGIRMGREAGLPEQIIDIIPQHHGTRLMTYFHEKAKNSNDPSLGTIKEDDYRYPGPKPQTREAAIFMLADAVEAAARTVDEPSRKRLSEMIHKISNVIVLDGQFDECDLTFVDLDRIQGAFLNALVSMYHHRVEYPGFEFGKEHEKPSDDPAQQDK